MNADNGEEVKAITGVDEVWPLERIPRVLLSKVKIYTPKEEGEGKYCTVTSRQCVEQLSMADPLDGQSGRAAHLVKLLRRRYPGREILDLQPAIKDLRAIKSPSEIKLLRAAGRLAAEGIKAAMRVTRPGIREYQLEAAVQRTYLNAGAYNPSYLCMLMSNGRGFTHYDRMCGQLADGGLVLGDCAPDYRYYTSDIARIWPVSGTFSPEQRMLYDFHLAFHQRVLACIKPGVTSQEVSERVTSSMRPVFERSRFASDEDRTHAERLFAHKGLSHAVGMAVHDIGYHFSRPLEPGMVFSCEPGMFDKTGGQRAFWIEDVVLVTETGAEILTAGAPHDPHDIEAMVGQE